MNGMRIAVLVKQIPAPEQLRFEGTRLARLGVDLEVSAYCRRANAKAVELAGEDGEVVVFTMGPPSAEDALREMLACGATRGVHLCDPAFAGADTLATARALAAAVQAEGPFDLILVGVNSLDADTGQVGPELAELLDLPFAAAVRELEVADGSFRARLELDNGYAEVEGPLPAVLSTAERLCDPSKAKPEERVLVDAGLIRCVGRADLGLAPEVVGEAGSPTRVGPVRLEEVARHRRRVDTAAEAVAALEELGAFDEDPTTAVRAVVPEAAGAGPAVWCFVEPGGDRANDELLGEAAALAAALGGSVTAVTPAPVPTGLGAKGADRILVVPGDHHPERWASALAAAAASELPWALLVGSTARGPHRGVHRRGPQRVGSDRRRHWHRGRGRRPDAGVEAGVRRPIGRAHREQFARADGHRPAWCAPRPPAEGGARASGRRVAGRPCAPHLDPLDRA